MLRGFPRLRCVALPRDFLLGELPAVGERVLARAAFALNVRFQGPFPILAVAL